MFPVDIMYTKAPEADYLDAAVRFTTPPPPTLACYRVPVAHLA